MARLWAGGGGLISTQVLQELYVTLTNRAKLAMDARQARAIIANLTTWSVYSPLAGDVVAAIDRAQEWQVSLWDSLILVAAGANGASVVWSEDLNHGQSYGGVVVRNPFAPDS